MIRRKRAIIISLIVFVVCFISFGIRGFGSVQLSEMVRLAAISDNTSKLEYIKSELSEPIDPKSKYMDWNIATKQLCKDQLPCVTAIADSWNDGDWQKRLQNEIRFTELELQKKKFGRYPTNEARMQEDLAFNQALLSGNVAPRDGKEDGVSSLFNFLVNWIFYLVPLCVILLTSDLISGESASGSIKLLLQRKKMRTAIYISKFFSGLRWSFVAVACALLGAFLGGAVFGGVGNLNYPFLFHSSYVQTWNIFLLCLPVLLLSIAFYTALGLFLSVLFHNGTISVLGSTAVVSALVFFGRRTVIASQGNLWQFTPFECGDGMASALGKFSVPIQETLTNPVTGQMITINTNNTIDINVPLPIWGSLLILLVGFIIFFFFGIQIFRRKDLV